MILTWSLLARTSGSGSGSGGGGNGYDGGARVHRRAGRRRGGGAGDLPEVLNDDKPPASVLGPAVGVFQIPQHALKEGTRAGSEDVLALYQVRLAQHCQNLLRLRGSIRPVLVLASQMPPGYECRVHDSRPILSDFGNICAINMC